MLRFLLIFCLAHFSLALDCNQIIDSVIYDGSTVWLPNGFSDPQTIPANFNCTYLIPAPANLTAGLYANLTISNGLKGVNDYIFVTTGYGYSTKLDSRSGSPYQNLIIPGSQISVQIVTKSVFMYSKVGITVEYHGAHVGSPTPMMTGGNMNYLDIKSLSMSNNSSMLGTVTYSCDEPISISIATFINDVINRNYRYIIDGPITNQTKIYSMWDIISLPILTTTNFVTIVFWYGDDLQFVMNTKTEAEQFSQLYSRALKSHPQHFIMSTYGMNYTLAEEMINFDSVGIKIDNLKVESNPCKAYVVSGPPNNSSQVLLDFSKNVTMPQNFELKYLTVIEEDCVFTFDASTGN